MHLEAGLTGSQVHEAGLRPKGCHRRGAVPSDSVAARTGGRQNQRPPALLAEAE